MTFTTDKKGEIPKKRRHIEPPWKAILWFSGHARPSAFNNCIPCNLSAISNTHETPRLTPNNCVPIRVHVDCVVCAYFPGTHPKKPKLSSIVVQRCTWAWWGAAYRLLGIFPSISVVTNTLHFDARLHSLDIRFYFSPHH